MARSSSPYRKGAFYLDHIYGTRSPNWYICWFDERTGQTERVSTRTASLAEAKRKLDAHEVLNEELAAKSPEQVRICDLLFRYFDGHGRHRSSGYEIALHIRKLNAYFQELTVSALSVVRQERFVAAIIDEGNTTNYAGRILRTLRAALLYAERRQEISKPPHIFIPREEVDEAKSARPLAIDEIARLLVAAQAQSERLLLYCILLLGTGARPEAICELTIDQLNFEDRWIRLNPPGRKQEPRKWRAIVPMANALLPWLRRAIAQSGSGHLIEYRGQPVKRLNKAFQKAAQAAGLVAGPNGTVVPYSLRKSVATHLRRQGVDLWEIDSLLGHKQPGTIERYAEYAPDYRSAVAGGIDRLFIAVQSEVGADLCIASLASQRGSNVEVPGKAPVGNR